MPALAQVQVSTANDHQALSNAPYLFPAHSTSKSKRMRLFFSSARLISQILIFNQRTELYLFGQDFVKGKIGLLFRGGGG